MQGPGFSRMELALPVYSPHSVRVAFLERLSRVLEFRTVVGHGVFRCEMRAVKYFIANSLDGPIARQDGGGKRAGRWRDSQARSGTILRPRAANSI